jgi:hypothetical protein
VITLRLSIALLLCCVTHVAVAQAPVIVVAPSSAFAKQVADRLQAGLEAQVDAPEIRLYETSSGCAALATDEASDATIIITIGDDGLIQLCVRSRDGVSPRVLGPLPALDAAAVEQIATVVEASLDAIRVQTPPVPIAVQPLPESAPLPAPTPMPQTVGVSRPTAPARVVSPHANIDRDVAAPLYALTFAYQPMLWSGGLLVHGAHFGAQRLVLSSWLWIGAGLGFTLPFDAIVGAVGARFSAVTLDARLGVSVPLATGVVLDLSAGPRLEWLSVSTVADPNASVQAAPPSTDTVFTSMVAAVPRFAITPTLSLTAGVGAIFTHNPRAYIFIRDAEFVRVMDQAVPRLFLHLGAQLAL